MLKQYPKYKPTNILWLPQIPEHWDTFKIKHTSYVKGRIGWQELTTNEYVGKGPFLITGTDFKNGDINWENCHHVLEERYEMDSFIQLKEGDLLITKDGTIGKVAIVQNLLGKATLNSGIFLVRPLKQQYSTVFLFYVLSSSVFKKFFEYTRVGATVQHLYQKVFIEFKFPCPPRYEQNTIVNFLNLRISEIDAFISYKIKMIDLLNEKKKAIISQAVTGKIPLLRGDKGVCYKPSGIEWLGDIPEHWDLCDFKYLLASNDGGIWGDEVSEGNIVLRSTEINVDGTWRIEKPAKINLSKELIAKYKLIEGDLLLTKSSGSEDHIGKTALVSEQEADLIACYSNFMQRIRLKRKSSAEFYFYLLNSKLARDQFVYYSNSTSGLGNINSEIIGLLKVPLLSENEIKKIVNYIKIQSKLIEEVQLVCYKEIEITQEYKTTLISEAVTGKIDVRNFN